MLKKSETFFKAQASSAAATFTDFAVTILLTTFLAIWYVFSSFLGTFAGGITNFYINRYWVYKTKHHDTKNQVYKYFTIWISSIILNTCGVYLFTEVFRMHYLISKSLVVILVGICFNYYLHKTYVFVQNNKD